MKGQAWMAWAHPPEYPPSSGPVSCPSPPPDRDVHRLVFPAVGPQHAGVYKSVIANKLGKAACYAHLYVTGEAGTLRSAGYTVWPLAHLGTWVRAGPLHQLSFSSVLWGATWPCLCPRGLAIPWGLLGPKGPPRTPDLWLSDVVPGPPDGAPQVVAVTGRMITLAWNPPRSLDMAIGGFRPHGAVGGEVGHGQDRLRQGTRGARRGRQGPGGHTGRSGGGWSIGNRTEVALRAPSPWLTEPWLWVRGGDKVGAAMLPSRLRGTGCLGCGSSPCTVSSCSAPQSVYLGW